ncbi:MAG TPA: hypothetical protein VF755_14460 [Catenuloplanes sp.]|jgi:hypothetical protein
MPALLAFPLDEVLDLAAHATAAPSHVEPVCGEPPGPALLLVAADGVYLVSNGLPQYNADPGQAQAFGLRAVYADELGPGTAATQRNHALGHAGEALVPVPLPRPVITRLHKAAAEHYDVFTLTLTATSEVVGVARRRPLDSA